MMLQKYTFYLFLVGLALSIFLTSGCRSTRINLATEEMNVRQAVTKFIKATNSEDIKTLDGLYAEDFKSYAPIYDVTKEQLLKDIQRGFDQQNNQIKAQIIEIFPTPSLATVQLQWMILTESQEIIFAQNLLQIWKKDNSGWKLSRILFYAAEEVPDFEDFKNIID